MQVKYTNMNVLWTRGELPIGGGGGEKRPRNPGVYFLSLQGTHEGEDKCSERKTPSGTKEIPRENYRKEGGEVTTTNLVFERKEKPRSRRASLLKGVKKPRRRARRFGKPGNFASSGNSKEMGSLQVIKGKGGSSVKQ